MLKAITGGWCLLVSFLCLTIQGQDVSFTLQDLLSGPSPLLRSSTLTTPCTTPDAQQGVCDTVKNCPPYLQLLRSDVSNTTVEEFFKKRICRKAPQFIHVCCPIQDHPQHATTTTPRPHTTFIPLLQPSEIHFHNPSQRPNARQPPRGDFEDDDENDRSDIVFFPNPANQPNHFPLETHQPSTPRPRISLPPATTRATTTTSTGSPIFRLSFVPNPPPAPPVVPQKVPSIPATQKPSQPAVQNQNSHPTVLPEPKVIPAEGVCGNIRQRSAGTTPWMVSVGTADQVVCGGALISTRHVIIAAHCLHAPTPTQVWIGDRGKVGSQVVESILSWVDAGYNPSTRDNDLALITLANPVTFTDNIQPVCLPFRYRFDGFQDQQLQVVGWGGSPNIEEGPVKVKGLGHCRSKYNSPLPIANIRALFSDPADPAPSPLPSINPRSGTGVVVDRRHLCGSPAQSTTSDTSCLSEHGAPLFYNDETTGLQFLVGVSSIGEGCQAGPGLYTRIGAFLPWLSQQLGVLEDPPSLSHTPSPAPRMFPERASRG